MNKKIILLTLLSTLFFTGCAIFEDDQDYVDDKSWNQPAGWENSSPGVGF